MIKSKNQKKRKYTKRNKETETISPVNEVTSSTIQKEMLALYEKAATSGLFYEAAIIEEGMERITRNQATRRVRGL